MSILVVEEICNQECVFCSAYGRKIDFSFKNIIRQIIGKGDLIQISGGEPLLNKDIFKIIAFIKKYKPKTFIEFQSNGILISKNKNYNKLLKLGVDIFNINYPSHIDSITDVIVGTKNTKEIRDLGIKKLLISGGKVRLTIIINSFNLEYLKETVEYIHNNFIGIERIQFSFIKIMGLALENLKIIPSYENVSAHLIEALEICKKYNLKADVDHIPMCYLNEYANLHVDYKKIISNMSGDYKAEKKKIKKCLNCEKGKYCSGFRIDYINLFGLENEL